MIRRLSMEKYRGFERYALEDLARVNLLVGKNNSGKTSLLEAVALLADGGDLRTLDRIARQRGESEIAFKESDGTSRRLADISHFFHGHSAGPGSQFSLMSDDQLGDRSFEIFYTNEYVFTHRDDRFNLTDDAESLDEPSFVLVSDELKSSGLGEQRPQVGFITQGGALDLRRSFLKQGRTARPKVEGPSSLLIPQESLDRYQLVRMWDAIITEGREDDVIQAMRILEPDLTSIAFLSGGSPSAWIDPRGGILVGFRDDPRRRPLGSHGEGMRRLLTLAVVLAQTKGGVLMIDEVDTGLHYSVLGDVWKLIVEAAVRYDIQVFLTTHSLDCLRALGWLCGARPDLGAEVSVQKIERGLDRAVALDASQIQIAVEQDIEVR